MKQIFIKWAKTEEYRYKVKQAKKIIEEVIKEYKPYIAFSGGKDSTCLLHLVLQFDPDILVWHWDYGKYMPREFEKEIIENVRKIGAKNLRVDTSMAYKWKDKVFYKTFFGKIQKELAKEYDAVFVGLRKEESIHRRERIKVQRSLGIIKEFWPLQDWSWRDVWAYIFSNNLPYHSAYDKYIPLLGWNNTRFATFFDPEFDTFGASNIDGLLLWGWKNVKMEKTFK